MKKLFFILSTSISVALAQSFNVQNAANYLRNKELDKAKAAADAAVNDASTANSAKAWMYRGKIYYSLLGTKDEKYKNLDPEAAEKAVESFVKCFELDKDKIYYNESDVKEGFIVSCNNLMYKATAVYRPNKEFEKAIKAFEILDKAVPFDPDQALKRNNITKEKILFEKYKTYILAEDLSKAKELADQLYSIKYKDPSIYISISRLSLSKGDTATAMNYLHKGQTIFDDNMDLLNMEIDILSRQKKLNELKQKLETAVETNPDNEAFHAVLGNLYDKSGEKEKAEKEYLKALELNPKNEPVLFNVAAYYFNTGNEWNKKLGDLPPKETQKAKEYEAKANEYYKKAIQYFEEYYALKPDDKAVKQRLRQLYLRFGDTEKADKYK
ncbi:MAG: tetratricopeptide repeat protein [Bacteroidota bacterium]